MWELLIKLSNFEETAEKAEKIFPIHVSVRARVGETYHHLRYGEDEARQKFSEAIQEQLEKEIIPEAEQMVEVEHEN